MRELNFSIPSGNRASVSINQNLYDRRALDTTSTLPLINSLHHLTYLTTSSARIRDILTVDGGVERLVAILKDGRNSRDAMENCKWCLCFQCVVNIGVRGSEAVRTRVVEADIVPVVATLLDNYIKIVDKCREKADHEAKRNARSSRGHKHSESASRHTPRRHRHGPPPPIDIPTPQDLSDPTSPPPAQILSSPPERTTFRGHHHHQSLDDARLAAHLFTRPTPTNILATSVPLIVTTQDSVGLQPVRDIDRLPSMLPMLQGVSAQPESPTTPNGILQLQEGALRPTRRRPSIRHQLSISNQSDIMPVDDSVMDSTPVVARTDLGNDIAMQDIDGDNLEDAETPVRLEPTTTQQPDALDMARTAMEASLEGAESTQNPMAMSPMQGIQGPNIPGMPMNMPLTLNPYHRYIHERSQAAGIISSMPRDEDIILSLQLLAYVSKYCSLRSYFHKTHLVPRLKTTDYEMALLDGEAIINPPPEQTEDELEEYTQPDDFNIFPWLKSLPSGITPLKCNIGLV
jgi:hypothetical protein